MTIAYHCDAATCDTWAYGRDHGWVTVTGEGPDLHFCSPFHVAQWAAGFEPPQEIR